MIMKQCSAGHFYDAERYDSCPYCGTNEDKVHTQPNVIPVDNGLEPTVPVNPTTGFGGGETIGLDMSKEVRPVVGWLVCIEAPIVAAPTKSTRKTTTSAARRRWTSTSPAMPPSPATARWSSPTTRTAAASTADSWAVAPSSA